MKRSTLLIIFSIKILFGACLTDHRKAPEKTIRDFKNKKGDVIRKITQRDTTLKSYKNGILVSELTIKNGKKEGFGYNYYPGGNVSTKFSYLNNLKHGNEIKYYLSGKVYRIRPYFKGAINGLVKKYYETGALMSEQRYRKGQISNELREFNRKGKLAGKYPEIIFRLKPDNYFKQRVMLYFYLSNNSKNVKFYHGKLIEGKYFPEAAVQTGIRNGIGEIALQPEDKGKTINVIARTTTKFNNACIIQASYTFR